MQEFFIKFSLQRFEKIVEISHSTQETEENRANKSLNLNSHLESLTRLFACLHQREKQSIKNMKMNLRNELFRKNVSDNEQKKITKLC
jgi:hypothetical protein